MTSRCVEVSFSRSIVTSLFHHALATDLDMISSCDRFSAAKAEGICKSRERKIRQDIDFIKITINALVDLIFPKTNKTEEQEKFKVVKIDENFQFTKPKKSRFKIFNKK